MEDAKAAIAAHHHQQQQHQNQRQLHQQQFLLFSQIQQQHKQQQAISQFPSNIDAHLRPPQRQINIQQPQLYQNPNPNPNANLLQNPNPMALNSQIRPPNRTQAVPSASPPANQAELQMAYQDAWRVCHPDFERPCESENMPPRRQITRNAQPPPPMTATEIEEMTAQRVAETIVAAKAPEVKSTDVSTTPFSSKKPEKKRKRSFWKTRKDKSSEKAPEKTPEPVKAPEVKSTKVSTTPSSSKKPDNKRKRSFWKIKKDKSSEKTPEKNPEPVKVYAATALVQAPKKSAYTGNAPLCNKCNLHHTLDCGNVYCGHCKAKGHITRDCPTRACFGCGVTGHSKKDCPKTKNQNPKQVGGRAFVINAGEARRDLNTMTGNQGEGGDQSAHVGGSGSSSLRGKNKI